jgi:hypothetical protein
MKLSDLREHTREGRWSEPGLMRWRLDIGSLQELVADIDRELIDLEVAVRREERDAKQKLVADIDVERNARFNEGWDAAKEESRLLAQRPVEANRTEYWRGRDDGHKALASQLMGRMESVENTLRVAQDTAKAMHADKDALLKDLDRRLNALSLNSASAALSLNSASADAHVRLKKEVESRLDALQEAVNELRSAKQERGWGAPATEKASQEPPKRGTMAFAAAYEQGWIEAMLSAPPRHGVAQGWGAPATEERQALTARLRAQEEFAQTLRRVLDETRSRVDAVGEEDRGQKARIHTCEQELARLGKLANDNVSMRVELGNELKQRIENIERGVTSPAQLVPDMLKRVQALEAKVTRLDNEAAHYRGFEPNKKGKT